MKIKVGDRASVTKTITEDDIQTFGDLTGDHNPLHFDDEHARRTRFRRPISHGMLTGSLFSSIICPPTTGRRSDLSFPIAEVRGPGLCG